MEQTFVAMTMNRGALASMCVAFFMSDELRIFVSDVLSSYIA